MLCFVHVVLQIFIDLLQTLQEQLLFFLCHPGGHSLFGLQNVLVARLPHFRAAFCQANMLDAPVARVGEAFYSPFFSSRVTSPASVDCAQPKMLSNSLSVRV